MSVSDQLRAQHYPRQHRGVVSGCNSPVRPVRMALHLHLDPAKAAITVPIPGVKKFTHCRISAISSGRMKNE